MNVRWKLTLLALFFMAPFMGCGKGKPSAPDNARQFKAVAIMYGRYLSSHAGKHPANEEELREFVEKQGASTLKRFGLASPEELFVSPRDKQPLVWVLQGTGTNPVIAYEEQGLEGSRVVVTALGTVEELTEKDFRSRVK
jgi:hypothetical protein